MERFNSFSSDHITLTKRQVSMIMASILLFCLFVFIVGFFLGKRTVIDDFSSKVSKEALHDQIDFLLTTQSLQSSQDEGAVLEPELQDDENLVSLDTLQKTEEVVLPVVIAEERSSQSIIKSDDTVPTLTTSVKVEKDNEKGVGVVKRPQYAQLIGFGTKKTAQAFVNRLKKHDVSVVLKTMISKTASGKSRTWYQAVTPTYESSQELQTQVSKIKRLEHIRDKDIKIVYTK